MRPCFNFTCEACLVMMEAVWDFLCLLAGHWAVRTVSDDSVRSSVSRSTPEGFWTPLDWYNTVGLLDDGCCCSLPAIISCPARTMTADKPSCLAQLVRSRDATNRGAVFQGGTASLCYTVCTALHALYNTYSTIQQSSSCSVCMHAHTCTALPCKLCRVGLRRDCTVWCLDWRDATLSAPTLHTVQYCTVP